jgi:imidazolonepropionase-like amidohydrolase
MFVLHGGRFLDPRRDALLDGIEVLVEEDRVREVSDRPIASATAQRIDLRGRTVMPGLIDAHVHMYMNEMNVGLLRNVPPTYAAAKAAFVLRGMLMRGFTSVRDMGGGDYGMRDAADAGYVETPRLFVSGRAISQTGGHGDFRLRPDSSYDYACACSALDVFTVIADGLPEVIRAARDELRKGADHLKVMLSGGVASPNDPLDSLQYRTDEIEAIVEEATRWGSYVGGHAYADEAIRRGVAAGVRTIEHGNFIQPGTAKLMVERDAFMVPTLITYHINKTLGFATGKSAASLAKNDIVYEAGLSSLEVCRQAGVPIGFGTDLSMHTQKYQCDGLAIHRDAMPAAEVLRSVLLVNARILRREGQLGELVPGAFADLLVVDGDPYADLGLFQEGGPNIAAIMKGGRFFKNAL